ASSMGRAPLDWPNPSTWTKVRRRHLSRHTSPAIGELSSLSKRYWKIAAKLVMLKLSWVADGESLVFANPKGDGTLFNATYLNAPQSIRSSKDRRPISSSWRCWEFIVG